MTSYQNPGENNTWWDKTTTNPRRVTLLGIIASVETTSTSLKWPVVRSVIVPALFLVTTFNGYIFL